MRSARSPRSSSARPQRAAREALRRRSEGSTLRACDSPHPTRSAALLVALGRSLSVSLSFRTSCQSVARGFDDRRVVEEVPSGIVVASQRVGLGIEHAEGRLVELAEREQGRVIGRRRLVVA